MSQAYNLPQYDDAPEGGAAAGLGLLVLATALVLALSGPQMLDSGNELLSGARPAIVDRVMEWRPQGPPPWVDADQLTPDEVEEVPAVAAAGSSEFVSGEMPSGRGGDLRARPER